MLFCFATRGIVTAEQAQIANLLYSVRQDQVMVMLSSIIDASHVMAYLYILPRLAYPAFSEPSSKYMFPFPCILHCILGRQAVMVLAHSRTGCLDCTIATLTFHPFQSAGSNDAVMISCYVLTLRIRPHVFTSMFLVT